MVLASVIAIVNYDRKTITVQAIDQIFEFVKLILFLKTYLGGGLAPSSQTVESSLINSGRKSQPGK
jgi:hypothetical protein